ncbi:MAG: hypothetical protein ILA13_11280 [Eubacterium sp.]|nr:hypothetical protein [Eubacterium sp.]
MRPKYTAFEIMKQLNKESWEQGSEIILTKNENYWDDSLKLDFDIVDFKFIPDASVAKSSLESGEIDFYDCCYCRWSK